MQLRNPENVTAAQRQCRFLHIPKYNVHLHKTAQQIQHSMLVTMVQTNHYGTLVLMHHLRA